jgi:tRNAThr (cytosine32-N3)-methyltransferase
MSAYDKARILIDAAHAGDPEGAELAYADAMERWLEQLVSAPSQHLRLAARCQHLERWTVPRSSYPMDKVGYLTWRKGLYSKQADRAQELLLEAGVPADEAAAVRTWVSKTDLKQDPGSQALEDAACLVFLEGEIADFAAAHAHYTREKFIDIIRKTWRKMSPKGHELALTIPLPPAIGELVQAALQA